MATFDNNASLDVILGSDLTFPINGNFEASSGINTLLQDIQLLLLTVPGERPMRPNFGCTLYNQIWENIDTAASNGLSSIKTALTTFEPRIKVVEVLNSINYNTDIIIFTIKFIILTTNTPYNLVFPFRTSSELAQK